MLRLEHLFVVAPFCLIACSEGGTDDGQLGEATGGSVETGDATGGTTASIGGGAEAGGEMGAWGDGGESTGGQSSLGGGASGGAEIGSGGAGAGGIDAVGGAGNDGGSEATGGDDGTGGSSEGAGGDDGSGGQEGDGCPFSGNVQYQLNGEEDWPLDVVDRLTTAMDEAVYYYNCYADLTHSLTVNYDPGVPTAQANVDGWITFGDDPGYMVVATAMHEVAHSMGVGFFPWTELIVDGRWIGPSVDALMKSLPAEERDSDDTAQRDYITADGQHFWPYGLNYASEHESEWSLINHVRIVSAMRQDKQAYLDGDF